MAQFSCKLSVRSTLWNAKANKTAGKKKPRSPASQWKVGELPKPSIEILRRGFLFSPENSELYLCPTNLGLSDKGSRSARPGSLPSRDPFLSHIWIWTENRQTRPIRSPERRVINTLSGLMKSRTSAFASCSAKPDWSITGVVLLLKNLQRGGRRYQTRPVEDAVRRPT